MEQKTGQISESVRESEKHFLFHMEELKQIIINADKNRLVRHHHVIDLSSSKVVVSIVSISVLLLTSLIGNIHQFEINSRMTDNDLKYRYIKSTNGISAGNLRKLEDIFHYHRDKKKIREIRGRVEEYEKGISETAKKMERTQ
ncbi:hypothetical protein AQPE_0228 [Aquipluma nitroreducens]|uniref:Uncharacterized protein n=1 Tax=Aquipluma nitroreducens TaxID=2010828 RepID=A0A5K7S3F2_9BACT|nr:hypothetical protein [Aquipluma nitroreducens]BBE16091.1 hypothetical protein AQPE_0228 [Aquipluma nitroreducens]